MRVGLNLRCLGLRLFSVRKIWVQGAHVVVHEAQRGVVDDVGGNYKVVGVIDLPRHHLSYSVIVDPDLLVSVCSVNVQCS